MNNYYFILNRRLLIIDDLENLDIRLKYNPILMNLNKSSKLILKKGLEKKSVHQIVDELLEHYNLSKDKYDQVLDDVMELLKKLWNLGVIRWQGDFPYSEEFTQEDNNYIFQELTIENDMEVLKNLKNSMLDAYTSYDDISNINYIDMMFVTKNLKFYKFYNKVEKKYLFLTIQLDTDINQINIQAIKLDSEIDRDFFNESITWCVKKELSNKKMLIRQLQSFPILIFTENSQLINLFVKFDFKKVGTLKKEVNKEDVTVLIKYIEQNKLI